MLKDYLKEKNISIYSLSRSCAVPYSTLNDLANGKVSPDNCKVGLLRALASGLGLSMDEVYSICTGEELKIRNSYNMDLLVRVRNKSYYVVFEYSDDPVSIELCKVNSDSSFYIEEIARWRSESYVRERRMSGWY
ncbi:MAG: helix-turn-helix transcriptional regulator [Firmicutes bacterium]|nr:helix-turn-helix transcriptional regulator [Bacillota bacterium]